MSLNIQLFIEGKEVELFADESITIKQSIQEIRDIGKIFTDFSKTFDVPASDSNNKIFKHFYDFAVIGYDTRIKKSAEIYLNHQLFKKGRISLQGSKLKGGSPLSYSLTFYGSIVNLKDFLGEDKIDTLDGLKDIIVDYTPASVVSMMQAGVDKYVDGEFVDDGILFPLITHTDQVFYNSTSEVQDSKNLYPSTDSSNVQGPSYTQFKPAVRVYAIIKAIEKHYTTAKGFSANIKFASGGFFDSSNGDFFDLYMWLHKKEGARFDKQVVPIRLTNLRGNTGDEDLGNTITSTTFTLNEHYHTREFFLDIKSTSSISGYNIVVKRNGEEFERYDNIASGNQDVLSMFESPKLPQGVYEFFAEFENPTGINVVITIKKRFPPTFPQIGTQVRTVTFDGRTAQTTNEKLTVENELPEIKVIDFLTGLFKLFNLTAFVNNKDEIVVKTLDQFYADNTNNWNISDFVDNSQASLEPLQQYKSIIMRYQGLEMKLAENHKQVTNKEWGSITYKGDNEGTKASEGDDYKIEVPFEHFKFTRLQNIGVSGQNTDVQVGFAVDKNDSTFKGKPLLFYPIKITGGTSIAIRTTGNLFSTISNYYIPSNSRFVTDSQTINFSAEMSEYANVPFRKSLFESFYKNYISDIFKSNRRLIKLEAFLPLRIILNLEMNNKFIIGTDLYRINSIQTNFQTLKSKIELINEVSEFTLTTDESLLADTVDKPFIKADSNKVKADNSVPI